MPQNQEEIEAKLAAYIDGELDAAGRAEIEKHLETSPQHRALIRDLMQQRDLVRSLPRENAPAEISETLQGQLERSVLLGSGLDSGEHVAMRMSRWPHRGAIAAIILLTAGLGFLVYKVLPSNKPAEIALAPSRETGQGPATFSTEPPAPEQPVALADRAATNKFREISKAQVPSPAAAPTPGVSSVSVAAAPPAASPTTSAIAANLTNSSVASAVGGGVKSNNTFADSFTQNSPGQAAPPVNNSAQQWCVLVTSDDPAATDAQIRAFLIANQIRFEPIASAAQSDDKVGNLRWREPAATQPAPAAQFAIAPTTQPMNNLFDARRAATAPTITNGSVALAFPAAPTTAPAHVPKVSSTTSPTAADVEALAVPATQATTQPQSVAESADQFTLHQLADGDQIALSCVDVTPTQANDLKSMLSLRAGQTAQIISKPFTEQQLIGGKLQLGEKVPATNSLPGPATQPTEQVFNSNEGNLQNQQFGATQSQSQDATGQLAPATEPAEQAAPDEQKIDLVIVVRRGATPASPTTAPTTAPVSPAGVPPNAAQPPVKEPPATEPLLKLP